MLKLLETSAFTKDKEPTVTILDLTSPLLGAEGLEKKAAHEEVSAFVSTLQPKPNHSYLHILAMTSSEYYSSNRNGDFFPEANLKKYYKTFETTPAHVYRSHINKDPARSYGKVIFAIYNERMHRVELVCECPNELVEDINARIAKGEYPAVSMATKTPADRCSICNNVARTRQEYCQHLTSELGKLYPDGRKVFAINDQPLTFFDISIVVRPADPNASILSKVASDGAVIGSAELAEIEGLTEDGLMSKKAEFKKWAELIKEITGGEVLSTSPDVSALLDKTLDLPPELVPLLEGFELNQTLVAMADLGINPSINFLAELIARKHLGEGYEGIGEVVEEYVSGIPGEAVAPVIRFEEPAEVNPVLYTALRPYVTGSSLFPEAIEKRASGVGYAGLGPYVEPTVEEEAAMQRRQEYATQIQPAIGDFTHNYGKLLLTLGAAALLAKYFINSQIEKKLRQSALQQIQNNAKIELQKQSSDYRTAATLSKASMNNSLSGGNSNDGRNQGFNETRIANKLARRAFATTKVAKTSIGGKLTTILKLVGIGSGMASNIN